MAARTWPTRPSTWWTWSPGRSWAWRCTRPTGGTPRRWRPAWSRPSSRWPRPSRTPGKALPEGLFAEAVLDKGDHRNQACQSLPEDLGLRTYVSEPERGRRKWHGDAAARQAVYAHRRRVRSDRGKELLRRRGEFLERGNAHLYETGGLRRTHLRGHENILKRLIVHAAGFNLGLLMRKLCGIGKPRVLQDLGRAFLALFLVLWTILTGRSARPARFYRRSGPTTPPTEPQHAAA